MDRQTRHITPLAQPYGRALFDLAMEEGVLTEIEAQMQSFLSIIVRNDVLLQMLNNPTYDNPDKGAVLVRLVQKADFHPLVGKFVGLVCVNGRGAYLNSMLEAFLAHTRAARGVKTAYVKSARTLTKLQLTALQKTLKGIFSQAVDIHNHVDPDLLGGLVVQVGSRLYDSSLKTRIEDLRLALKTP